VTTLLDVNVLVALFFPEHVHHEVAHDWFADHADDGWATCPITENGFARVAPQLRPGDQPIRAETAVRQLARFCASDRHEFWPAEVSILDPKCVRPGFIRGPRQLTDVYLLALATKRRGCLVTFDAGINLKAVVGATARNLQVVTPA
jgi:toxin-antitoxin system PIN domain toxin